jgi:signal transduction histidine kinase
VRDAVSRLEPEATAAKCTIQVSADAALVGRWDRGRVEQIVTNVLTNAIKYGESKPVDVVVARAGSLARISVTDRGAGIPETEQARIFERFERGGSAAGRSGVGLGLYISRRIARALSGDVRVTSVPGKGSTFTLELPLGTNEVGTTEGRVAA